jgi:putative transposase
MGAPPRLEHVFLKSDTLTYFFTCCVDPRLSVLANPPFMDAVRTAVKKLPAWHLWCGVIMPDHLHFLLSPLKSDHSISDFLGAFKRWTRKAVHADWTWQKGSFDRLLRSDEQAEQKWAYIRENPVRKGLVSQWADWPYRIDWTQL